MTPKQFCEKYLENYTINHDGIIDVDDDVGLYNRLGKMEKLPVKFGKVSGYFECGDNNLTTLKGRPSYVGGSFSCNGNKLTSLEHGPNYVGENLICGILTHHILGNVHENIYYNIKQRIVI
jgi:hypothetical protein